MTLTHVMTPIKIADVELRNRVVRTAHATLLGMGAPSDDLIAYHVARGRGGVGLSIIEVLAVHWSSPMALSIDAPGAEDGYRRLVEAVRPTGMKLFQQLQHAGHVSAPMDGSPPWSSSDLPGHDLPGSYLYGVPARPMTKTMIDEVVASYANAACKLAAWGIDGVEVHAAHGYLMAQFLNPILNRRTDDYGGSFENRIRLLCEVLSAIRSAVPKGFPVGARLAPDLLVGGLGVEETIAIAQYLEERGLLDYVNISLGSYPNIRKAIGGMHEPAGYQMPTSAQIGSGRSIPRLVTGRFRTLEEADQVIRAGDAEMVSMVRALIADPELINKTLAGQPEQVRPCIACNQGCLARTLEIPYRMGCAVNPGAGFELSLGDDKLTRVESPRRVLVVGGGVAGMEAARVAALRGHQVTLVEAMPSLGGSVTVAARAPTRHGLIDFVVWLEQEIYRLGVEVRLSTYLDADEVAAGGWDAVVVATGSMPRLDGVQTANPGEPAVGVQLPHVLSSNDLMMSDEQRGFGRHAVVVDDLGHYEGLAAAEFLAARGVAVHFVTRHVSVAPRSETSLMVTPALERMAKASFTAHLRSRAARIEKGSVSICPTYLPATPENLLELPADTVVFVSANQSNRELYDSLLDSGLDLRLVGDANAARLIPDAVREGHMAGLTL